MTGRVPRVPVWHLWFLTLPFLVRLASSHTIQPAILAVQPSISTFPCISLDRLLPACYPSPCLSSSSLADRPYSVPSGRSRPGRSHCPLFALSSLPATLMVVPVSVANKRLTACLSPLAATFTKYRGWGPVESDFSPYSIFNLPPIFRILFQVPYPATPLFATLTKTTGGVGYSSHSGTRLAGAGGSTRLEKILFRLPRITSHGTRAAIPPNHFLSSCWSVAFTRKGSSKSVVSPQPLPVTGRSRAESGLCHFTARLAMSLMISESCSALVSPGRGMVSRPVPQTAE